MATMSHNYLVTGIRSGTDRQRAPEHRALPRVRLRGRSPHPRGRQRRAVRQVLRGRGPSAMGGRSALREERRSRAQSGRAGAAHRRRDPDEDAEGVASRARAARHSLRADQSPRPGLHGSASRGARPSNSTCRIRSPGPCRKCGRRCDSRPHPFATTVRRRSSPSTPRPSCATALPSPTARSMRSRRAA